MQTSDMVIITNRSGIEYEVTKERAEKMVKNGDIEYADVRPIGTDAVKPSYELHEPDLGMKDAPIVPDPATIIDGVDEIKVLRAEYKEKFGKGVAIAKINDKEWIKAKLEEVTSNA